MKEFLCIFFDAGNCDIEEITVIATNIGQALAAVAERSYPSYTTKIVITEKEEE